jgi:hypothetical protein
MEDRRRWRILRGLAVLACAVLLNSSAEGGHIIPSVLSRFAHEAHNGDIIFRRGLDATSHAVLALNPGSHYSHVGMIVFQSGRAYVVHAVPAEAPGEQDAVKIEPLSRFLAPNRASATQLMRVKAGQVITDQRVADRAAQYAVSKIGVPFDFDYNMDDDRQMYCTELIWKAYLFAGVDLVGARKLAHFPLLPTAVIGPDVLLASSRLNPVP